MCELERLFTAEFAKQSVALGRLFTHYGEQSRDKIALQIHVVNMQPLSEFFESMNRFQFYADI
jgi:hypothetical protein